MSNEEIVAQIQNGVEITANQERLWERNRAYVVSCIRKYVGTYADQEMEDLVNEGFIGLITAAMRYQASHGAKFLTYATPYIRNALYAYLGQNVYAVHIPKHMRARLKELEVFRREYRDVHHREPGDEEIREALGISSGSLHSLEKAAIGRSTRSLDECAYGDGEISLGDILESGEDVGGQAEESEYQRELHAELEMALSILDRKTALMIRCVFYQGNGYGRTAQIFRCSRQAVYDRIRKGFYRILQSEHREKLESFMWEGYRVDPRRLCDYADMEEIDDEGIEFLL